MRFHTIMRLRHCQSKMVSIGFAGLLALGVSVTGSSARQARRPMAYIQAANLHVIGDSDVELPGAATLKSTRKDIWVTIHARELDAHAAYTLWAIVFNNPSACSFAPDASTRCGAIDLSAQPNRARASSFALGGFLTDADGAVNISAHFQSGPLPEGTDILWGMGGRNDNGVTPGLRKHNGLHAEIHFILRTHGDLILGHVAEQISTLDGGCPPNACSNQQAVEFPPARQ